MSGATFEDGLKAQSDFVAGCATRALERAEQRETLLGAVEATVARLREETAEKVADPKDAHTLRAADRRTYGLGYWSWWISRWTSWRTGTPSRTRSTSTSSETHLQINRLEAAARIADASAAAAPVADAQKDIPRNTGRTCT